MSSASDDQFGFFQSLDELNLADSETHAADSQSRGRKSRPKAVRKNGRQNSAPRRKDSLSVTRLRGLENGRSSVRRKQPQEELAFDLLNSGEESAKPRRIPGESSNALTENRATQSSDLPAMVSKAFTGQSPSAIPLRVIHKSAEQSKRVQSVMIKTGVVAVLAVICWLVGGLGAGRTSGPMKISGRVMFEPQATTVQFIQILKLNSPHSEDAVCELRDGAFEFPDMPHGLYAMWFTNKDGQPVPCIPVRESAESMTIREHYLEIEIPSEQPLQVTLMSKEKK